MAPDEKHEVGLIDIGDQTNTTSAALANAQQDQSLLEKQTRTLRLFSRSQLFAFSLVYLGTGYYVAGSVLLSRWFTSSPPEPHPAQLNPTAQATDLQCD